MVNYKEIKLNTTLCYNDGAQKIMTTSALYKHNTRRHDDGMV